MITQLSLYAYAHNFGRTDDYTPLDILVGEYSDHHKSWYGVRWVPCTTNVWELAGDLARLYNRTDEMAREEEEARLDEVREEEVHVEVMAQALRPAAALATLGDFFPA